MMLKLRRWEFLLSLVVVATVVVVAVLLFLFWGVELFFAPPTPIWQGSHTTFAAPLVVEANGTTRLGRAFRFKRQGIAACALSGTPEERGLALGRLFTAEIAEVETSLMQTVQRYIPWYAVRWLLAKGVAIRNYRLPQYIPVAISTEMFGLALGSKDIYPQYGAHYARLLNYLAAHDLSHALMNDRTLAGCTAFGVNTHAAAGQVLLARNFDFEAGDAFDQHKLVMRIQPEIGHTFLSVAWPGMFGVVTGLNDAGIGVVLLAGHSADTPGIGTPVSLVARQVLEQAQTLKQAIAIIRKAQVFVSESFLVGSAAENAFVVVEKTPARCGVRGWGENRVLVTNHFLTPELKDDKKNMAYRNSGTSVARGQRLRELVNSATPALNISRCVAILRDRRAPGGYPQGWGNRQAINALIAAHSVVMDLKRKVIWVSAGPHQMGPYVPFALEAFEQPLAQPMIPADKQITAVEYEKFKQYTKGIEQGEALLLQHKYQAALAFFMDVRTLNPEHYRSFYLAGLALEALHSYDEARYNFLQALFFHPAFPAERRTITTKLKQLKAKGF